MIDPLTHLFNLPREEKYKSLYKRMNAGEQLSLSPIPFDYIDKLKTDTNSVIITSNPEVVNECSNVCGGLAIHSKVAIVMNSYNEKIEVLDLNLMSSNPEQAIKSLKDQIAKFRKNKTLKIKFIGNLPFLGTEEKLWQKILMILTEAGFDEIHLIIPAKGLISREMKNQSMGNIFPGLKSVHIIRPHHWGDELNTICAQIELIKDYTGNVTVYDDFTKLYSQSQTDFKGNLLFIAPCEQWPDFENVLKSQCGSDAFYKQSHYGSKINVLRSEAGRMMVDTSVANAIIEFDQTIKYGPANRIDKWWIPGQTRLIFKPMTGIYLKEMIITDQPVSRNQTQIILDSGYDLNNLKDLFSTSWGAFYIMLTYPSPHKAFGSPNFRLLSAFDLTKKWDESALDQLHGPTLTKIKNQILQRYESIYGKRK
jgi:hypothetical protein